MKPKTQMRIGLWGAIVIMVFSIFLFIYNMPLDLYKILVYLSLLAICGIYIFSIMRRNLKTTICIYIVWWIYGLVMLCVIFTGSISGERWQEAFIAFLLVLIIFLCFALPFGVITFILWTGLKGLKEIAETKDKLKNEKSKTE